MENEPVTTTAATTTAAATTATGMNIPLVKFSDMPEEMRTDSVETVSTAIETALEKHPQNYENAAKAVKTSMDRKYGKSWHCIIGEGYGFCVNYEVKNLLYMYFNNLAILVFKAL
jgi:dynein light chain 4